MRTPQEWLALRTEVLHDGGDADLYKWIATIQKEAFEWGVNAGVDLYQKRMENLSKEMLSNMNKNLNFFNPHHIIDCCSTDQCKVTTEELSPGDKRDIYGNIK